MSNSRPEFFYGWAIVAFTFLIQFVVMGSAFYIFGVLLKPLSEALGADRFLISLGLSSQMVVSAIIGPWLGGAIARYSIRLLMGTGIATLSIGLLMVSQATTLWHFYIGFSLVTSSGLALAGPIPNAALIANWFNRKRGTAMGVSQFGVTFSGAILVPTFTWLMLSYDWRISLMIFAVAVPVIALPIIFLGIVKTPEEKGLYPDGDPEVPKVPGGVDRNTEWTMKRALKSPQVWKIALIIGPGFMGITAVILSIHSHMTDLGLSVMGASSIVAAMSLMGAFAKPLFGTLADYINKRLVTFISIGFQFIGICGILLLSDYYLLMISAGIFGLGYGGQMPLFNIIVATIFGRQAFAKVIGLLVPIMLPFNLAGLPFTTFIYETYGSYVPAYAAMLVFYLTSALILGSLKFPESDA